MTIGAGKLRHRVCFSKRETVTDDAYGNKEGDWKEQFTEWGAVLPLRGSEVVLAARQQGIQPVIISVRSSRNTRQVTTGWRAKACGVTYNIRTVADMKQDGAVLEMLAESGVADG